MSLLLELVLILLYNVDTHFPFSSYEFEWISPRVCPPRLFLRHLLTPRSKCMFEDKHAADMSHNLSVDLDIFPQSFISLLRPFFHIFLRFSDLTEHVSQDLKYLVELEFVQTLTYYYHRCLGIQVPFLDFYSRFVHHIIQQFLSVT